MKPQAARPRVVVITGGTSGIGRACVDRFGKGTEWTIVSADLNTPAAETADNNVHHIRLDVTDPQGTTCAFDAVAREHGGLDAVVHCAGIKGDRRPVGDYEVSRWQAVLRTNLDGTFHVLQAALPHLLRTQGSFVAMASTLGLVGARNSSAYVAAKHGTVGLIKAAALDYADAGVRINAIAPGHTDTPFLQIASGTDTLNEVLAKHPMGRLGRPEEIAALAYFLSSPEASFTTGSVFRADGGYTSQ